MATNVSLPSGSAVTYTVNGNVVLGTSGLLGNTVTAAVGAPATDPNSANNTVSINLAPLSDRIFADDFE